MQAKDLLPDIQLVETRYVAADQIVLSRNTYDIELVGPPRADFHWQAHTAQGFAARDFKVEWEAQQLTCPQDRPSNSWTPFQSRSGLSRSYQLHEEHHPPAAPHGDLAERAFHFWGKLSILNGAVGILRFHCVLLRMRSPRSRSTRVEIRPQLEIHPLPTQEHCMALQAARQRQGTEDFKDQYAIRAGIKDTLSQGIRTFELQWTRNLDLAKTHLQHLAIATAMNHVRVSQSVVR